MNKNIQEKLDGLVCDDIAPKTKSKKRASFYIINFLRIAIFVACLAVFVNSMSNIIDNFKDYSQGEKDYDDLKNQFESIGKGGLTSPMYVSDQIIKLEKFDDMLISDGILPPVASDEDMEELLIMRNKLTIMAEELPGLYGWISIPGTNINYPIMQAKDNLFYVDHTAEGKKSNLGAIFVDYRCKKPAHNTQNLVIYGHNISSWGTMFNHIASFFNPSFFNTHRTIYINTFDGIYEYEIISIRETTIYDDYTKLNFSSRNFTKFIEKTITSSTNTIGNVVYDENSRLVTLSTCSTNLEKEKRYALVGIMTKCVTDRQAVK